MCIVYCVGKHFCFIFLGLKSRVSPERNNQHPAVSGVNGRNLRLAISIYVPGGGGQGTPVCWKNLVKIWLNVIRPILVLVKRTLVCRD